MVLEKVSKTGRGQSTDEPLISLRKSGGIGINSAAVQEWFEDSTFVNIYFDKENQLMGLEPLEGNGSDSFKLNKTDNSGSLTPQQFLNRHNLIPDVTTRYAAEWSDDEEMVIVDLSESAGTYGDPASIDEEDENEE